MDYVDAIVNNQLYLKQEPGEILEKLESLGLIKETFTNYYIRTLLN